MPNVLHKHREVLMRQRTRTIKPERLFADYRQAAALLKDDLVWSGDFETIRLDLMELIEMQADLHIYPSALTDIVQKLIAEENDLSW